jgi:crossover junction endodeoxyribonuclease RuvC|uniref:Crossover junction endodeoxyribonuclease RuvC n=1 Tax=Dictyoglomus turgidum TaxID=513050 RepID=A0A7C3SQ99_9BACT
MKVLGVDPGTAITGFGILNKEEDHIKVVDYGALITPSNWSLGRRLNYLYDQISALLEGYDPDIVVMENIFFNKNVKTAISIGQAQGIILLAAYQHQKEIFMFSPLEVKLSIVGYGRASKNQIQYMVKEILNLKDIPKPDDTADALAIALAYIYSRGENI